MKDYYELVLENALLKSALFKLAEGEAADAGPGRFRRIIDALKGYGESIKNLPGAAWERMKKVPGWVKEHPYKATAYGVGGLSALGGLAALPFLLGGGEEEVAPPPPPPGLLERALGFVREHPYLTGGVAAGAVGLPLLALLAARRRRRRRRD